MLERRLERSPLKDMALERWLCAVARRRGVAALVVADEAGLLVASNVAGQAAEEMAWFAALHAPSAPGSVSLDLRGATLVVRSIPWGRQVLHVGAKGDPSSCAAGIEEALAGIERIFAA